MFHSNSVMYPGPADRNDFTSGANGWNASNHLADVEFCHELQHSLRHQAQRYFGTGTHYQMDEVFSTGAEALVGLAEPEALYELPYTWPVMATDNYQTWKLLSAYLLFNFRGVDTTRTPAGIADDLYYRWSRTTRQFSELGELLSDANCPPCAQKDYFHPGGVSLDNPSRLALLLHHWRAAAYANNPLLAEGQYGFAGAYSPWGLYVFQSVDGDPGDDVVAVPPEVTATPGWARREATFVGHRYQVVNGTSYRYPMSLWGHGSSEYWVVRSDPALSQGTQDLVVRVTPEGVYSGWDNYSRLVPFDGRLVASAIAYSQQDTMGVAQPLWRHPNWASAAIAPQWVDVDSAARALELVIPNFGTTSKAAVIAISLQDGPRGGLARLGHMSPPDTSLMSPDSPYVLPYRLSLALRTSPYQTQNPQPVAETQASAEDFPTWSPAGDEIAFARTPPGEAYSQIYRRRLDGSAMTPLLQAPVAHRQSHPDWSPRGDVIAFDQEASVDQQDIWFFAPATYTLSQLTTRTGRSSGPSFRPDGQALAYVLIYPSAPIEAPDSVSWQSPWHELRRVSRDGTGDVLVVGPTRANLAAPRWSPDGAMIYFVSGDSLYSVRLADGAVTVVDSGLSAFDLPLGSGPLVIEQSGRYLYQSQSDPPANPDSNVAFRRIALRDRTTGDTQARFYRTSAQYFNPRWSFDGTRITYSSDQNNAADRDVFVGQVSYDHAPVFDTSVQDRQVEQGLPFDLTLHATDVDGETVTYAGAYLPPGATLNGSQFHWNVPANSAGQSYYTVFRALDPSGGVANKVVKFDIIQGGGGCPFADTWTAEGWQVENSILGRSLTGALSLDAYRLKATPVAVGGRYRLRLRENEQESTTLDQVRLAYVDHAPDVRAWALGERVVLGTRVPPYRVTTSRGDDITSLVDGSGADFAGQPGDTVLVELVKPGGAVPFGSAAPGDGELDPFEGDDGGKDPPPAVWRPADPASVENVDSQVLAATGILIQGRDAAGVWSTIRQRYPRANHDEFLVDTLDQGPLRMVFVGEHKLYYVGRVLPRGAVTPQALSLLAARHSRLGDVRVGVASAGDATIALLPGDTLGLEFAATPVPAGQVRDFFVLSKGVYTSSATQLGSRPDPASAPPTRFALLQNRPNPFTGGTVIGFELPRTERVRLEVFDLQGRAVRIVADASYAAGRWSVEWDGRDAAGSRAAPGVYLYRMEAGEFHAQRKLISLP